MSALTRMQLATEQLAQLHRQLDARIAMAGRAAVLKRHRLNQSLQRAQVAARRRRNRTQRRRETALLRNETVLY